MKKILVLILGAFVASAPGLRAENVTAKATLTGTVLNASRDDAPVAKQEVVLYTVKDGKELDAPRPHVVTDAAGKFVFKDLEVGEGIAYYPLAVYTGVEYSGRLVTPDPDTLQQKSNVVVYDLTAADTVVSAMMHHLILEPGNGILTVREVYLFQNRSKFTYFGDVAEKPGMKVGLRMEVPAQARELQLGGSLMQCCTVVEGNQIYNTMEFKPGQRQVVLNYQIPYDGNEAQLFKTIRVRTASIDAYLPGDISLQKMQIRRQSEVKELAADAGEPFQLRGSTYQRYELRDVAKGGMLSLALGNLPAAPKDYRWLAPLALIFIIGAGVVFHRKARAKQQRESRTETIAKSLVAQRQELLEQVLQLEERFESGGIDEEQYQEEREKLLQQILVLDEAAAGATENRIEG